MSAKNRQIFRQTLTTSLLAAALFPVHAAPPPTENPWRIDGATLIAVPFISQFVAGRWVQRPPGANASLFEIRGTLEVEGDGTFGPVDLAEVKLLSLASGVATSAELVAVGIGTEKCKYLPAQVAAGSPLEVKLGTGKAFTLTRAASAGPVLLKTRAPSLDLCMAFEMPGMPPQKLLWSIANRQFLLTIDALAPIPSPDSSAASGAAASRLPIPPPAAEPSSGRWAVSPTLLWGAAALATVALIGGLAALRIRRRREDGAESRTSPAAADAFPAPQVPHEPPMAQAPHTSDTSDMRRVPAAPPPTTTQVPQVPQAPHTSDTPHAPETSETGTVLTIPRVTPSHRPTTFARIEADGGPGQQLFREALAALRLGTWTRANDLFGQAIARGLTPTFETGAWSLRGEASLRCKDLGGAMTCFLRALSCPAVTTESAVLSASHLAVIYRKLGLRREALKMDKLKAAASPFGGDISQERIELIESLAGEFKRRRRAALFARLLPARRTR